jgi:hypothetical protein
LNIGPLAMAVKPLQNPGSLKRWLNTVTLKSRSGSRSNCFLLIGRGILLMQIPNIGHKIGIYIVEYLINFQKFNLAFNFILFDIG